MLQYLAEQSRRSLVLGVEEPEAFLHPAAQETQGSPRRPGNAGGRLTSRHNAFTLRHLPLRGSAANGAPGGAVGVTSKAASARGDEGRADLLGSLYRDSGLARVLERSLKIPAGTKPW